MAQFKHGDKVVHLGGAVGVASENRGLLLTIIDGPFEIRGFRGKRYLVDKPLHMTDGSRGYHANADCLLAVR